MTINKRILLRTTLALIFFLVLVAKKPAWALKDISQSDYLALVALYNATDGDSWYNNTNWLDTLKPTNKWHGVSVIGGRVWGIDLQIDQNTGNNLRGKIPSEIGNLTELQVLNLAHNYLEDTIPASIKNLKSLTTLNLSFNNLTWPDINWIGNMSQLKILYLNKNKFEGIPTDIFGLGYLEELGLSGCGLSGNISSFIVSLANLDNLEILDLGKNKINGSIPNGIDVFSYLRELYLGENLLIGEIPNSIGNLSNLTSLYLNDNNLSDSIPMGIWQLKNLLKLNLGQNKYLEGYIHPDIKKLTKLNLLIIDGTLLSGTIPTEIGDLKELQQIYLQNNQLSGSIPDSIGSLPILNGLNLYNNQLNGNIPSTIGDLQRLQTLDLRNNLLEGTIPTSFEKLTNLQTLLLGDNKLSGKIPPGIGYLVTLNDFRFQNNFFDEMPLLTNVQTRLTCDNNLLTFEDFELNLEAIGNLGNSFYYIPQRPFGREHDTIAVNDRPFTLKIPCGGKYNTYEWYKNGIKIETATSELFFPKIQLSDTGYYHIEVENDTVPNLTLNSLRVRLLVERACIERDSSALAAFFKATGGPKWKNNSNWLVSGEPLSTWYGIKTDSCSVTKIELPNNNLTGPIPPELYNLTNLETLNLSGNNLGGYISTDIGQLRNLQFLSLSNDSLSGTIPNEILKLTNLSQLSLSENQLTGGIPTAIGNLTLLKGLNFANNQLSGSIPTGIGGLDSLEYLALNNNQLTGNIPLEIGKLKKLKYGLMLSDNKLSGELPLEIGNLPLLEVLRIDGNILTGSIPANINNLSNLHSFQFHDNLISDISSLSTIDSLIYCKNNHLTFEDFELNLDVIREKTVDFQYSPQYKFGKEDSITIVEDNTFNLNIPCGGIYNHYKWFKDGTVLINDTITSELFFPSIQLYDAGTYHVTVTNDSVPYLTLTSEPIHLFVKKHCIKNDSLALEALFFATGGEKWLNKDGWRTEGRPVSSWYGITAPGCSVLKIDLTHNNLSGSISIPKEIIPPGFEYFKQLNHLFLDSNTITGEIPPAIGGFSELKELDLSFNNFFNGPIPDTIYSLKNLTWLGLHDDGLSGVISSKIGNLKKLEYLNLSDNRLERNIPVEIGFLSNLISLNFERNQLNDNIPKEIGNLTNLRHLILSQNQLFGPLPDELGLLTNLTNLQVNTNGLSGSVPLGISDLKFIDKIRLENNYFNDIPDLSILDSLLFCYNNYLTFEDFELNLNLIGKIKTGDFDFQYSPQYNFGSDYDTIAYEGAPFTLSIPTGGKNNRYKWYLNTDKLIKETENYELYFPGFELTDTGSYHITVTNITVPGLTLTSIPVGIKIHKKPTHTTSNCDAINQSLSLLTLKWDVSSWAESYALQVSTSPNFSTILFDTTGIKAASYTISNLEHGTKYYWRVNASDSIGTTSWSEVCNFTTLPEIPDPPTLESICDGPEIEELSLSVSWYDLSYRAESYSLQVSTTPDFSDTLISVNGIKSTSYTITTGLDFNTTYYWRVNARNITGASEWSEVCSFTTYQPELYFNNLVIIDGQHTPFFWIEGIKYNPDNNLVVFTRWGKKVYSKSGYNNELDFSAFPAGTYYYVLNVKINDVQKQYKNFVDVVKQ